MKTFSIQFFRQAFLYLLISVSIISCTTEEKKQNETAVSKQVSVVEMTFAAKNSVYTLGDSFAVKLKFDSTITYTSIEFWIDSKKIAVSSQKISSHSFPTDSLMVGSHVVSCKVKRNNEYIDNENLTFILLSNIKPVVGTFKIKRVIPHDTHAYTQGLIIENDKMFEGTGMNGESTLREVNMKNGALIRDIGIPQEYFGEGITIVGNKIVQLTWQSNIGFVYDKNSFTKLRDFSYPTEGWGLTYDGKDLIMSDGSEKLFYLDTANYSMIKKIEVYDNNSPITNLNELEYVDGFVYANIWRTDFIVKIDPKTGKIVERWEFPSLLKESDKQPKTDVLNGIAYDKKTKHYYITGKYWSKMFEVELK